MNYFERVISLLLAFFLLQGIGCTTVAQPEKAIVDDPADALLMLRRGDIELGILAEVGGRVVLLRRPGGENLLKSNPNLWNEAPEKRPSPSGNPGWKGYDGHIVWLGPQSGWWNQQDRFPKMKGKDWPPDPYLIYGDFEVVEKTNHYARLVGPESAVSGIRLTKEYWLEEDGKVRLGVTATNIRDEPVSWGIWTNTRFPGKTPSYMPLDPSQQPEYAIKGKWEIRKNPMPYQVVDGFFTFMPEAPSPPGEKSLRNKVFATPLDGLLAAFTKDQLFVKKADTRFASKVHPNQGFAEIYHVVSAPSRKGENVMELEFHGPYRMLAPGESMSFEETWELWPYSGSKAVQEQVDFLQEIMSRE